MQEKPLRMAKAELRPTLPELTIAPMPRCFWHPANAPRAICGELAVYVRRGRFGFDDRFYCPQHQEAGDELVAGERLCLRVEFTGRVLLSGSSVNPVTARVEALARLEAAIATAGGLLEVEGVRHLFGRYTPAPAPGGRNGQGGRGG